MSEKYPRTYHLPWSPGCSKDDKRAKNVDSLIGKKVVITEKVDGSNTCMTRDACFSRSHSGPPTHASFDGFKAMHASMRFIIPEGYQVFGEWCYALHSIEYDSLPSYFLVFGIRDRDTWLSWDDVYEFTKDNGLHTAPVLFRDVIKDVKHLFELTTIKSNEPSFIGHAREGVVVRLYDSFHDDDFSKSVMKWVRKDHVQTDEHWKDQVIVKNKLA